MIKEYRLRLEAVPSDNFPANEIIRLESLLIKI
jgi:hypothetical protein